MLEYKKKRKADERLRVNPDQHYEDFPGWPIFLGKKPVGSKFYSTLRKASTAVVRLGINSQQEYKKRYKEDPNLPADPSSFYQDTWKGWPKLFGRKTLKSM